MQRLLFSLIILGFITACSPPPGQQANGGRPISKPQDTLSIVGDWKNINRRAGDDRDEEIISITFIDDEFAQVFVEPVKIIRFFNLPNNDTTPRASIQRYTRKGQIVYFPRKDGSFSALTIVHRDSMGGSYDYAGVLIRVKEATK